MPVSGQLSRTTGEGPAITSWFSRCLSATCIRFLVILCPPGNWAFLAVGLPDLLPGPDPDGVATFRAHELRPGWGRVAGAHCCAPAPSEPDRPAFRASRLKQAQRLTGGQK